MRYKTKNIIDGFHKAAENSAAFDRFYYDFFSLDRVLYGDVPRPALWANNVKILNSIPKLQVFIFYTWRYFSFIYFFLQVSRLVIYSLFRSNEKINISSRSVALGVCQRSVDVIEKAYLKDKSDYVWLVPPGVKLSVPEGGSLSSLSVLSLLDLFFVFILACRIHFHFAVLNDKSKMYQTYSVVSWLVVFMSLNKLKPETIVTSEHHDRWAVLADWYCRHVGGKQGDKVDLVMVQHGSEFSSTYEKLKHIGYINGLPYRLENVTDLFVYDDAQYDIFKRNILSMDCTPNVFYYQYELSLSPVEDVRNKVLFVGNSFCEDFHIGIYKKVSLGNDFLWLYKPHPVQTPSSAVLKAGWNVIDDNQFFPKVELVISYPSTLASEYRLAGINVIEHSISCAEADFNELAENIDLLLSRKKLAG